MQKIWCKKIGLKFWCKNGTILVCKNWSKILVKNAKIRVKKNFGVQKHNVYQFGIQKCKKSGNKKSA